MKDQLMNKEHTLLLKHGFTLLELTCAIFVISVGLFGILHIYLQGIDKMQAINEYETALCALSNEMETLRTVPFDALELGDGLPFRSETPGLEHLHLAETLCFIAAEEDGAALKRVTVRIRWIGEHGRRIEKELTTLIARTTTDREDYADAP